jgi:hypothetical protein
MAGPPRCQSGSWLNRGGDEHPTKIRRIAEESPANGSAHCQLRKPGPRSESPRPEGATMTRSVRHLAPRNPSARTLAVAGAITVSALTASALTALALPGGHAGRSHSRSSVTPAGVVAHTDQSARSQTSGRLAGSYPSGYNPFNMPDPTASALGGGHPSNSGPDNTSNPPAEAAVVAAANAPLIAQNPDLRTALNPPVGSNVPDLRAALYPFSTISPVNPSATGLFS